MDVAAGDSGKRPAIRSSVLVVAVLMVLCVGAGTEEASAQDAEWAVDEVATGIFRFAYGAYNTVFIVADDGVVAFDPISPAAAPILAQQIQRVAPGAPLLAIVYSHHHADHAAGAGVLRAVFGARVPIIAQENALPPLLDAADPSLPPPDVTFAQRLVLRPGGREIELLYLGPSHTSSMIVGLVPDAGFAFAVDFVSNDRVGYRDLGSHVFPDFFHALELLDGLAFDTIVYGHGPNGDHDSVKRQIRYYRDLREAVERAIDAGWSEDEAAQRIRLAEYEGWGGYEEWFALNVRGVYRWLAGPR